MRRLPGTVAAVSFCLTKPFSVPYFREQYSKMVDEQAFYADTHAVITGTMTQNAITIKADGGKRSW